MVQSEALLVEMTPLLLKAGLKQEDINRITEKADAYDRIVIIRRTVYAEYAEVRALVPESQWEWYAVTEATYHKEVQLHNRAASRLRREWRKS